jgi:hypothetical protein
MQQEYTHAEIAKIRRDRQAAMAQIARIAARRGYSLHPRVADARKGQSGT